jgi:hypothetical protein
MVLEINHMKTGWWCNNHLGNISEGRMIPYIMENKKWLKPPTRK